MFPSAVGQNVSSNNNRPSVRPSVRGMKKLLSGVEPPCAMPMREPNLMIFTLESVRSSVVPGFSERCANYTNGRFLSLSQFSALASSSLGFETERALKFREFAPGTTSHPL